MTPEAAAYLVERAKAAGYNPSDLLRVMNYESSGDPTRWGGKGGNYFGLIQFGPEERAKYGVNTEQPSATNQIDATFRFLADRGYKPGMPLIDLYSTVNAGSPGHYNASDGNGTVASHVSKMMGTNLPASAASMPAATPRPVASAVPAPQPTLADVLNSPQAQRFAAGLLGETQQAQPQQDAYDQEFQQFHQMAHQASLKGLLGGTI